MAALAGCDMGVAEPSGVVTARDLTGTYTGILQGVTVGHLEDVDDPDRHVIVDLDLLHELTIREAGPLTLRFASRVIPPFRAFVLGFGPVAINADFVEFEGPFDALRVKQVVFVQHEGEWVLVLQLIRVAVEPQDDVYVYQYVSYPSRLAARMEAEAAIRYVNAILRLVSAAQR